MKNLGLIISTAVFLLGAVGIFAVVSTMSQSVKELAEEKVKGQVDVILASANVNNNSALAVPILYYDQKMDDCVDLYSAGTRAAARWRQFEWTKCGYQNSRIEKELVEGELSSEFLPVSINGELVTNRGLGGDSFKRWFNQVDNHSQSSAGTITIT